jgi:hypothetical protein
VANAKLSYRTDVGAYLERAREVKRRARGFKADVADYPQLIHKCFSPESLQELDKLRRAWGELEDGSPASELTWLTLISILRPVSHAGTAPWQYVLPRKSKKSPSDARAAFDLMTKTIAADMQAAGVVKSPRATLIPSDARTCDGVPDGFATLVITSPPYANNYDYADATRLEMCFMREIDGWGDLQKSVRRHLIRSCSQHVPESAVDLGEVLATPELAPIRAGITDACQQLAQVRLERGGKKTGSWAEVGAQAAHSAGIRPFSTEFGP